MHYGFCTAVCPTYVLLRDENDAPRGRIDLIREMLESDGPPSARTVGYIDRCLSCNSCMSTCAARVDYMHLADIARAHIERRYRRPVFDRLFRWFLARTVPDADRFRRGVRLAGLARALAPLLPGRLRTLLTLAPPRLPPQSDAVRPGVYPADGTRLRRVILSTGCVQQALAPELNTTTIRLLARHGCEVVVAPDAACCGAFTLHMGKEDMAKASARACIDAWARDPGRRRRRGGRERVRLRHDGQGLRPHLRHEPDIADKAKRVADAALDITELMAALDLKVPDKTVAARHRLSRCLFAEPRAEGDPAAAQAAARRGLQGARRARGTFLLRLGGCLQHASAGHRAAAGRTQGAAHRKHRRGGGRGRQSRLPDAARLYTDLPIAHTVELLDWATGGPLPEALAAVDLPPPVAATDGATDDTPPSGRRRRIW